MSSPFVEWGRELLRVDYWGVEGANNNTDEYGRHSR
jgi:hypothetical protein